MPVLGKTALRGLTANDRTDSEKQAIDTVVYNNTPSVDTAGI